MHSVQSHTQTRKESLSYYCAPKKESSFLGRKKRTVELFRVFCHFFFLCFLSVSLFLFLFYKEILRSSVSITFEWWWCFVSLFAFELY